MYIFHVDVSQISVKQPRLVQLSFSATGTEGLLSDRAHQLSGSNPYLYLPSGQEICYLHSCHQSHATTHLSFRPTSNPELAINLVAGRFGGRLGHVRSGMHLPCETDLRPSLTILKTPYVANMGTVIRYSAPDGFNYCRSCIRSYGLPCEA